MIIVDSGLGGISVVRALRTASPDIALTYIADTAGFPYGRLDADVIAARAERILRRAAAIQHPGAVVVACNTLSTLCLDRLRAAFPFPFVGTVPAVKVAALTSPRFTLLATPNTAHSAYSQDLIARFAGASTVDCVGAPGLAVWAERMLLGLGGDPAVLAAELAPAFKDDARGRTGAIVLGCTHYPLIVDALRDAAPWPVRWIDSGAAIARRARAVSPPRRGGPGGDGMSVAYVTSPADVALYSGVFTLEGFHRIEVLDPGPG